MSDEIAHAVEISTKEAECNETDILGRIALLTDFRVCIAKRMIQCTFPSLRWLDFTLTVGNNYLSAHVIKPRDIRYVGEVGPNEGYYRIPDNELRGSPSK